MAEYIIIKAGFGRKENTLIVKAEQTFHIILHFGISCTVTSSFTDIHH
jgi:hypothetical protein